MKSTLILIFCLVCITGQAKIDTLYNTKDGVNTMKIVKIPSDTVVLKEWSFENTTNHSFTTEDKQTLFAGGVFIKNIPDHKVISIFPPLSFDVVEMVYLKDGKTKLIQIPLLLKLDLGFLIFGMVVPFLSILLLGFNIKREKKKDLITLYCWGIVSTLVGAYSVRIFDISSPILSAIVAGAMVVVFFKIDFFAAVVAVTTTIGGSFIVGDDFIVIQYTSFIVVSCLVSYGIRQLWLRRRSNQEQVLRVIA